MNKEDLKREYEEFLKIELPAKPEEPELTDLYQEMKLLNYYIPRLAASYLNGESIRFNLLFFNRFHFFRNKLKGNSKSIDEIVEYQNHLDKMVKIILEIEGLSYLTDILIGMSWYSSPEVQIRTIQKVLNDENFDYSLLIQQGGKDCWDNCAKVFTYMEFDKLKLYIPRLLEWLQDMNWPGALTILKMFRSFPKEKITPYINEAVKRAIETEDDTWEENLRYI